MTLFPKYVTFRGTGRVKIYHVNLGVNNSTNNTGNTTWCDVYHPLPGLAHENTHILFLHALFLHVLFVHLPLGLSSPTDLEIHMLRETGTLKDV